MKATSKAFSVTALALLALTCRVVAQGVPPMTGTVPAPAPSVMSPDQSGVPPVPLPPLADPTVERPVEIHADSLVYHPDKTVAQGRVLILLDDARIVADKMELDNQTMQLDATGHVNMIKGTSSVSADRLTYNLKTRHAIMVDVVGRGSDFGYKNRPVNSELFFWADSLDWDSQQMVLHRGVLTTCDLPVPHYHIAAESVVVKPNDEIVVNKARFFLHDREKIGVPRAQFSLKKAQKGHQTLFPQFGYNSVDGVSIKESIPFGGNSNFYGLLHLDYYQLSGLGGGITDNYKIGKDGQGYFYYYSLRSSIPGAGRYQLNSHVNYSFPNNLSFAWYLDTSQFGIPGTVTPINFDSVISLTKTGKRFLLSLSSATAAFTLGNQTSVSTSYSFLYKLKLTDTLSNLLNVDYTTQSTAQISSFRLHTLDHLNDVGSLFDTSLDYEFTSGTSSFFVNREPEVTVRSHPLKLEGVPLLVSVGVGEFDEQPTNVREERTDFKLEIPEQEFRPWDGVRLYAQGGFRQLFYQDGDEKYVTSMRGGYIQDVGDHLTTRLDLATQNSDGFSPFQSDFIDKYNNVSGGVEFYNKDFFRASLLTGYDVSRNLFQDVLGRINLNFNQDVGATIAANYDANTHDIQNIDNELRLRISPEFYLQTYELYDTVNKRLTYNDFALTREQHDFVTQLVYRGVQNEFFLQFSLKGFPYAKPTIGPNPGGIIQGIPGYTSNSQGLVPTNSKDAEAPYGL